MSEEEQEPEVYSLGPQEKPIHLKGKDGTIEKCVLREFFGDSRDKYLGGMSNNVKYDGKGKVIGLKNYNGSQAKLLSRCLFHENDDPFTIEEIQGFPASLQNKLHEQAQKMNGLDNEDSEDDAKNE